MNIIFFIIVSSILIIILKLKEKITLRKIGYLFLFYLITIPLYILVLLIFKKTGFKPDKELTISLYVSLLSVILFVFTLFIIEALFTLILNFQIRIGNKEKSMIKNIVNNKITIINILQYFAFAGFCYINFALWFLK